MTQQIFRTRHELRCVCRFRALLAYYGLDDEGKPYIHLKVYKKSMVFGEIVARGSVQIKCRQCLRWYTVNFVDKKVKVDESTQPDIPQS